MAFPSFSDQLELQGGNFSLSVSSFFLILTSSLKSSPAANRAAVGFPYNVGIQNSYLYLIVIIVAHNKTTMGIGSTKEVIPSMHGGDFFRFQTSQIWNQPFSGKLAYFVRGLSQKSIPVA